jgi:hypothetical protein
MATPPTVTIPPTTATAMRLASGDLDLPPPIFIGTG